MLMSWNLLSFTARLSFRKRKKVIGWHRSLKGVEQLLWPYWQEIFAQTQQSEQQYYHVGATHFQCVSSQVIFAMHLAVGVEHLHRNVCSWFLPVEGICDAHFHSCHKNMISMHFTVGWTCWASLGYKTIASSRLLLCFFNILRASLHQGNWRPQGICNLQEVSPVLSRKSVAQLASTYWGRGLFGHNFFVWLNTW